MNTIKEYWKYKDWYLEANNYLLSFGDEVFIALVCATSPRKTLKANINLSKKLYLNYLNGINIFKGINGILPAHKNNILRAIKGETLKGDKVSRFYENLTLNLNVVTIDVWIKRYFKLEESITTKQYKEVERKIKNNARKYKLKPAEYQAIIWNIQRSRAGFKPQNYI